MRLIELRYGLHQFGARLRGRQQLDRETFTMRRFYPDLVGVGLSHVLQRELDRVGSDIEVSWPEPLALCSGSSRGVRSVQVLAAEENRSFCVSLWADGIEYLVGWAGALSEVAAAIDAWLSDEQPGGDEMTTRFRFLALHSLAGAYERGEAIEHIWRELLENGPVAASLGPLLEAAAAEPRLHRLRPWTSMDRLCFSRWVGWPFSDDLPYAAPRGGCFRVYRSHQGEYLSERPEDVLGEGDAAHAVSLLVAALPEPLEIVYRRPGIDASDS